MLLLRLYGAGLPNTVWSRVKFQFESLGGWLRPDLTGAKGDVSGQFFVDFSNESGVVGVTELIRVKGYVTEGWTQAGRWGST